MKKIGIMGGTFDPIHVGHLMIAEAVWDEYNLEKVIFIPSANPPHKHDVLTSAKHRFNMTLLATCSNPHFEVSTIEMDRVGPSYTIDTIKALKKMYGDDTDFYFIIGADCIHELPTWHKIDELLKICKFIATKRPSYEFDLSIIEKYTNSTKEEIIIDEQKHSIKIITKDTKNLAMDRYVPIKNPVNIQDLDANVK